MSLVTVLATAVLPVLSVTVVGYLLGAVWDLEVDSLNTVTLQVLLPALAFHSLATSTLGGAETGRVAFGVVLFVVVMIGISRVTGRLLGTAQPYLSALVLVAAFPNSGNFGIPLAEFAFGATGRTTAVLFVTVQNVLVYTAGAYIASRGYGDSGWDAVTSVVKLPLVYAAGAALLLRGLGFVPPVDSVAMRTVGLAGDASIPLMLLILGIQLADVDGGAATRVLPPSLLRLGIAPVVGLGVVALVGIHDPTVARVFVLECATPAAILPLVLLLACGDGDVEDGLSAAQYASTAILVTTAASVVVLSVLIVALRSHVLL